MPLLNSKHVQQTLLNYGIITEASHTKSKQSKTSNNNKKKSGTKKKVQKLSYIIRPAEMGLVEWQKALRKKAAEQENLIVSKITQTEEPGCYSVVNPSSDNEYKVIHRGANSK